MAIELMAQYFTVAVAIIGDEKLSEFTAGVLFGRTQPRRGALGQARAVYKMEKLARRRIHVVGERVENRFGPPRQPLALLR